MTIPQNKRIISLKAFLVRAVITVLFIIDSIHSVTGWCWTTASNNHQHFSTSLGDSQQHHYHQLQSCSLRPAFAPRSRQSTILYEKTPYRRQRKSPYDNDDEFMRFDNDEEYSTEKDGANDIYDSKPQQKQAQQPRKRRPRTDFDNYDNNDYDYDDPYATDKEKEVRYPDDEEVYEDGYYEDDQEYVIPSPKVEWEEIEVPNPQSIPDDDDSYSKVYVLLPPSPPTMHPLPSAVLHFVGGTLFGSAPKIWYRTLLEDIVTHTQCAIVVTPLPVITPLNSKQFSGPLHHVSMARRLQYQFQYAYEAVLEDEYGHEAMKSVPIAALGHSLGSRLLVVLATLMKDAEQQQQQQVGEEEDSRRQRRRGSEANYQYKSLILMSFTNYGAAAGIPGLSTLLKQRAQLDQKKHANPVTNDIGRDQRQRTKKANDRRSRRSRYYDYDDFDDYDDDEDDDLLEELSELWVGFRGAFENQADRVKTVLTPQAKDLEFYPTPRQLWQKLEGSTSSYRIPQTLLIQFDQDDMDQSSKLATVLVSNNQRTQQQQQQQQVSNDGDSADSDTTTDGPVTATVSPPMTTATTDLKFARLRGTHLTPISTGNSKKEDLDQFRRKNRGLLREWSSRTTQALWRAVQGRVTGGSVYGMTQEEALLDLRQSITRYIADVVTK